jgi:predicted phosphohydrolase
MSKMKKYTEENGFSNIYFLQNNFYEYKDIAVCGTRGWNFPSAAHSDEEDKKIYKREVQRLELSLSAAPDKPEKIVFTHFPPVGNNYTSNEFTEMLKKYNVRRCVYGHLHAKSAHAALTGNVGGVEYLLVSCDYVKFMPVKLSD